MRRTLQSETYAAERRLLSSIIVAVGLALGLTAAQEPSRAQQPIRFGLYASQVFELAESLDSAGSGYEPYSSVVKLTLHSRETDTARLIAYEENQYFIYALGSTGCDNCPESSSPGRMLRRIVVLKPSIFIIDDQAAFPARQLPVEWQLYSQGIPEINGQSARVMEGRRQLLCQLITPRGGVQLAKAESSNGTEPGQHILRFVARASNRTRFVHLLQVSPHTHGSPMMHSVQDGGKWSLMIPAGQRIYRITLPPPAENAGEIAITTGDGRAIIAPRPLASGVLPHGPEGRRSLELWDADYRREHPPLWDIGRPADELQKLVDEGAFHSCRRVVDLGCGSGTDAIYLARKGFEVTAIDIAPTALSRAQLKAHSAGVHVQWLLADVLAPPHLEPFDLIYDRGCYHVVRNQSLSAYIETVRRLSHSGTRFLLLAARQQEGAAAGGALDGVTEEELRYDFLPLFDLERLREIRLESTQPGTGPPGWAALFCRAARQ